MTVLNGNGPSRPLVNVTAGEGVRFIRARAPDL
jgi:hypothetical protein